jgi:glutathione-independent formaldehyde dehydrogenase
VAIFGAGPVGLLSAYCSVLKGASEIYVVDSIPERLAKAKELGATPVDFSKGDPVEQIFDLRKKNKGIQQGLRPGEEKMKGVDCAIDAVGYQARSDDSPDNENPTQVLENCVRAVNATGSIGMIGVSIAPDPGPRVSTRRKGSFPLPSPNSLTKESRWAAGRPPVKKYNEYLRDLIVNGRAKPSKIIGHRIQIDQAPDAYEKFDQGMDGYTKVVIRFGKAKAARPTDWWRKGTGESFTTRRS